MEKLIRGTSAFQIFSGDRRDDRQFHAYLLLCEDAGILGDILKIFALEFFGETRDTSKGRRIWDESFSDCVYYPAEGEKITVDGAADIVADANIMPVEGDKKLFVIRDFSTASAAVQNKLLKTLEEPPRGSYFLLGAVSASPILPTVRSRVRQLEIPRFSEGEILAALNRKEPNPKNAYAAKVCGGMYGYACDILGGGWFDSVAADAKKICSAKSMADITRLASDCGATKHKKELIAEMARILYEGLRGGELGGVWSRETLVFALDKADEAAEDVEHNAYFPSLLFDYMVSVASCEAERGKR